jgi:hypothetical protein
MTERERTTKGDAARMPGEGIEEQRVQALFAAADPRGEPSEALVRRVSDLGSRCAAAPRRVRGWWSLGGSVRAPAAVSVARWCAASLLVVALVSLWPASRQDRGALAAVLRASATAPAMHVVGRGTSEKQELWFVAGVGCYLYGKNPKYETILVDDMKHYYRYELLERRVYVTRSLLAEPRGVSMFWEAHSGTGLLRELLQKCGENSVSIETVKRDGRTLRQLVGPRRVTRITIDPETDRILVSRSDVHHPDGTVDWSRYDFDYPDPATVDRSHFRFKMPQGVTIVDQTRDR